MELGGLLNGLRGMMPSVNGTAAAAPAEGIANHVTPEALGATTSAAQGRLLVAARRTGRSRALRHATVTKVATERP